MGLRVKRGKVKGVRFGEEGTYIVNSLAINPFPFDLLTLDL